MAMFVFFQIFECSFIEKNYKPKIDRYRNIDPKNIDYHIEFEK